MLRVKRGGSELMCLHRPVPLGQPIMKALPALMAGNCCIIKTSPFTPYSGMKVVELAQRFLPPGVLQVLSGDDRLGPWLTHHPGVDKISFTGSTASGRKVAEAAARGLKRVTLELYVRSLSAYIRLLTPVPKWRQ